MRSARGTDVGAPVMTVDERASAASGAAALYSAKMKSKRSSGKSSTNTTFAVISAGTSSSPTIASRNAPSGEGTRSIAVTSMNSSVASS